jgi:AbrB family looped-hinge helix DNA binding protein
MKGITMPVATITSKGQITIPREIRRRLKLKTGDKIDFVVGRHGEVIVQPATVDIGDLLGILQPPGGKHVSVEEMTASIRKRFSKTDPGA